MKYDVVIKLSKEAVESAKRVTAKVADKAFIDKGFIWLPFPLKEVNSTTLRIINSNEESSLSTKFYKGLKEQKLLPSQNNLK